MKAGSTDSRFIQSMRARRTSRTDMSKPLRADIAWRRKLSTVTPANSSGCWKPRNRPRWARSSVDSAVMSSPLRRTRPEVTS